MEGNFKQEDARKLLEYTAGILYGSWKYSRRYYSKKKGCVGV
jgi:hypothetical protein